MEFWTWKRQIMSWSEVLPQCGLSFASRVCFKWKLISPPPTALKRNAVTKIALVWWAVWLEGPPFSPECNETPLGVDAGHKGKHLQWGNPRESIFLHPPSPPISTKLRSEIVLTHPLVPCDEMCRDKRRTNWCGETLRPGTVSSTTGNSETSSQENKIVEMLYSHLSLTVKKKKNSMRYDF